MKTLKLFVLSIIAIIFAACKASQPTAPPSGGATPSLLEVSQILDSTQSKFLSYSTLNNGNAHQAIMQTTTWLQSQPNVQSATALDSVNITIFLKSGLRTTFSFDEVDDSGYSLFRGGSPDGKGSRLSKFGTLSDNTITNKNVLIYCAAYGQFYRSGQLQIPLGILQGSDAGLTVTVLKDADCTYQMLNTFQNYGLVILDTHGLPDAFMIGSTIYIDSTISGDAAFKASIVNQYGQDMLNKLLSGEVSFFYRIRGNTLHPYWKQTIHSYLTVNLVVTSKYIDELSPMPGTIVFGNMCYSGWQTGLGTGYTPIEQSFINKNPISYYGYAFDNGASATVSDAFAKLMEDTLSYALANDLDTTKIANLEPDHETEYSDPHLSSFPLYFKHFGADDYSYEGCGGIFVDPRDGQKYTSVCIGDQTWMAQNLNYDAPGSSRCYNDDTANCSIYGKLYDWPTLMQGASSSTASPSGVQGVCPKGWHVPSLNEFDTLINTLGGNAAASIAMKSTSSLWPSPNPGATNSSGFSALPASFGFADGQFFGLGGYSYFWTATQNANNISSDVIYLVRGTDTVISANLVTSDLVPCRCVKN
jgi:uncharacterized protein (TIGR02145 family)